VGAAGKEGPLPKIVRLGWKKSGVTWTTREKTDLEGDEILVVVLGDNNAGSRRRGGDN